MSTTTTRPARNRGQLGSQSSRLLCDSCRSQPVRPSRTPRHNFIVQHNVDSVPLFLWTKKQHAHADPNCLTYPWASNDLQESATAPCQEGIPVRRKCLGGAFEVQCANEPGPFLQLTIQLEVGMTLVSGCHSFPPPVLLSSIMPVTWAEVGNAVV